MNPLVMQMVLGFEGVPEKDIQDLEKAAPAFARLCRSFQKLAPQLKQAETLSLALAPKVEELMPQVMALLGLFKQIGEAAQPEKADIETVVPVIQEYIAFVIAKSKQGA